MSRQRRLLLGGVAVVLVLLVAAALLLRAGGDGSAPGAEPAPQDQLGPVLLVSGYGGGTGALQVLAQQLRAAGRTATVVAPVGDGTGDLRESAQSLARDVDAALGGGAPSVDVIGFSAGGVVARLWADEHPEQARRVVTLGSPHHGTQLAATGAVAVPGACPVGCQQLVPGSELLEELNEDDETPDGPQWLSLWTAQDQVVTPPDSARLEGALNVVLQDVCPGIEVPHGQLPTEPLVAGLVLEALGPAFPASAPGPERCDALRTLGGA
jgi:triacylglycerol esterase/lipase EstA (alpha/beta hydrolase family)